MKLEFEVKITPAILYDYMLHHTYNSASGLIGTTVGALMVVAFFMGSGTLFLIIGAVIIGYLPWTLWIKSRQQAIVNPAFREPLHYRVEQKGIEVSQGEECQSIPWDMVCKAVSTKSSIVLYTSRVNAFIFPRKDLDEELVNLLELIHTNVAASKIKIRR